MSVILLVDDDQDHCELLRAMLVRLGWSVTATTSAEEALDHASRGYVMETGQIVLADTAESLKTNEQVRKTYLGEG